MRKLVLLVGVLSWVLAVSACGGGGGEATIVKIEGKDPFSFTPNTITASAGKAITVEFNNTGVLAHTFTIDELKVDISAASGSKKEATFTPSSAGTYAFYCSTAGHRAGGMVGTLTVQ